MIHLLDANVFIQAKNSYYSFELCPGFWKWIIDQSNIGSVKSIEKIGGELRAGNDALSTWALALGDEFFLPPDDDVVSSMPAVSTWAASEGYSPAALSTFLQSADYYLVAHAFAHQCTVVTHEIASFGKSKVKIPNACKGMNVPCITLYELLRKSGAQFVLAQ